MIVFTVRAFKLECAKIKLDLNAGKTMGYRFLLTLIWVFIWLSSLAIIALQCMVTSGLSRAKKTILVDLILCHLDSLERNLAELY